MERLNEFKERYKEFAKIWHQKGRKAFNDAIYKQELPNWDDFFEEAWKEFITITVKCPKCSHIKSFEINLNDTFDKKKELGRYINLLCRVHKDFVPLEEWEVIE